MIRMIGGDSQQYVVFRLGDEEYGFDVSKVREIQSMENITVVHGSSEHIEGVMNLRGKLVTIINLRKRFGLTPGNRPTESKIVVVEASDAPVGFMVDEVMEVTHISRAEVEKVPGHIASKIESEYVVGIAKREDRLITLIDPLKVLELSCDPTVESRRSRNG